MELGLSGKKVIMNGGAHGLGLASLKLFAAEGADVAFFSRDPDKVAAAVAELSASGGKVLNSDAELAQVLQDVPPNVGPPVIKRSPLWSNLWILLLILGLFTVEWSWRRHLGLA